MSVRLRYDQCCETEGCLKPRHIGSLCASCFQAATPARRATELLADAGPDGRVSAAGEAWLDESWAAEDSRQATVEFDSHEVARRVAELDADLKALPTYLGPRRFAA